MIENQSDTDNDLQTCKPKSNVAHIFAGKMIKGVLVKTNPIAYCGYVTPDNMNKLQTLDHQSPNPICPECFRIFSLNK